MSDSPTLTIQFTQTFTVSPPESVTDGIEAENFYRSRENEILRDVLDPMQGEAEVLHVNG